jgi:hypothetical protein
MRKVIALLTVLGAGCTTMAADQNPPIHGETPGYECKSAGLDVFVGRDATAEIGSEILAKSGAKVLRWLQPGQIVTMEFRADRVNVKLNAQNKIEAVTCG